MWNKMSTIVNRFIVVSTSAFLVFFLAFSYRGVYYQWHSHCPPPSWYYVIADQKPSTIIVKAAMAALNSSVQKAAQNREKPTSGDYFHP